MKQKKQTSTLMKTPTTRLAATFVLLASIGAYYISPWFLAANIFVALNMLQFTYTKWCLVDKIFKW